jgi:hypothetical protein
LPCGNTDAPLCRLFSALSFVYVCVSPYDAVDRTRNLRNGSVEGTSRYCYTGIFHRTMVIIVGRLDEKLGHWATLLAHPFDIRRLLIDPHRPIHRIRDDEETQGWIASRK